jgi:ubiquinone/menaquinone biosynthesis C-methylase UbiE
MRKYLQSCKTDFWKKIFEAETDYLLEELKGYKDILSVGCGPAIIEAGMAEYGFSVTGLDISKEALNQATDSIRTIEGSAEQLRFAPLSFDSVIYVASIQFIEKYRQAVEEALRVLKSGGKLLVMLLNPESKFFKEKSTNPDSYINKIKHTDIKEIEQTIREYFFVQTEFFLGIRGQEIFESQDPSLASLYVIKGKRKA